jgi:hypothetical protein
MHRRPSPPNARRRGVLLLALLVLASRLDARPSWGTVLVATHDSAPASKDAANFVGDGKGDQEEINAAIEALPPVGGTVLLAEGTYDIRKVPDALGGVLIRRSHVVLEGQGTATKLIQAPEQSTNVIRIIGSGVGHIMIRNLWVDANRSANPYGEGDPNVSHARFEFCGIKAYYRVPGGPSGKVNHHVTVENCYVLNSRRLGIMLEGPYMRVRNNVLGNAGSDSVEILTGPGEIRGNQFIITGRTHVAVGTDRANSITMADNIVEVRDGGHLDIAFRSWAGSRRHVIANNVLTVEEGGICSLAMDIRGLGATVTGNSLQSVSASGTRLRIRGGNTIVTGNLLEQVDIEIDDTTAAGKAIVMGDNILDNSTVIYKQGHLEQGNLSADSSLERHADFRKRPNWEGVRHRLIPASTPTTVQDFGYRATHHAGASAGEIGGRIARSMTPASYAKVIPEKTLEDPLHASGKFAFTAGEGNAGVLFGWFHTDSHGWRTNNSLAFRLDGNGDTCWVFFEYGTQSWHTGSGATFSGRYQTTADPPLPADGNPHQWILNYDPKGAAGQGEITFVLDGKRHALVLTEGHKKDGARFNRFGILNQQLSGDGMTVYFDDLTLEGRPEDFAVDPGWEANGCVTTFEDRVIRPLNDFGYSETQFTGGDPGEVGGTIWRTEQPSYYADRVGPLTLRNKLTASGKVVFLNGMSDAGVHFGWFRSGGHPNGDYTPHKNVLGILLEGPSRSGHFFSPTYKNAAGEGRRTDGPKILPDGKPHRWSLHYEPGREGAPGQVPGQITVTLDDETVHLEVAPGHKDAVFDRFGIFNTGMGGHCVQVYLDDLAYTTASGERKLTRHSTKKRVAGEEVK